MGVFKRLYFGRKEYMGKDVGKRFRKENAVIDGLAAMVNIVELKQLYQVYETHIKKAKDYKDKTLLLPFQNVPVKPKTTQKRVM